MSRTIVATRLANESQYCCSQRAWPQSKLVGLRTSPFSTGGGCLLQKAPPDTNTPELSPRLASPEPHWRPWRGGRRWATRDIKRAKSAKSAKSDCGLFAAAINRLGDAAEHRLTAMSPRAAALAGDTAAVRQWRAAWNGFRWQEARWDELRWPWRRGTLLSRRSTSFFFGGCCEACGASQDKPPFLGG